MASLTGQPTEAAVPDTRWQQMAGAPVTKRRPLLTQIAAVVILIVAVTVIYSLFTTEGFEWDVVGEYIFSPPVLQGVQMTLILTVICMALGIALGTVLAIVASSQNVVLRWAARIYIWVFRGTPLLVQLIFLYNLGALFPEIQLGVPFLPPLLTLDTNQVITAWMAAVVGLSLNEAAYMSEVIRGGFLAISPAQREAAQALGMTRRQVFFRIVLPQALRVIVPPTGNQMIMLLKYTSLVSVIALHDLLYSVQSVYTQTFQVIPLLIVASIWYLAITSILSIGQSWIERYFGRGYGVSQPVMRTRRKRATA
jgi:polar amino acid transport system permease protein